MTNSSPCVIKRQNAMKVQNQDAVLLVKCPHQNINLTVLPKHDSVKVLKCRNQHAMLAIQFMDNDYLNKDHKDQIVDVIWDILQIAATINVTIALAMSVAITIVTIATIAITAIVATVAIVAIIDQINNSPDLHDHCQAVTIAIQAVRLQI